ncbi:MAG: hypothetical protein JW953_18690 [Anaerolineae bacterium]|nr:hypothetical protein [Anaerolineae bacterium]
MNNNQPTFWGITLKTIITHTITYFLMGILAFFFFDYSTQYAETSLNLLMRQTTEPVVMAGPLFQPIRGFLFGIAFYLLREVLFGKKYGWLTTWVVLVIIGILSPFGPAPGSIEGMIFTVLPLSSHLMGQLEIYLQSFLLSVIVFYWVNHPEKKWLTWTLSAAFFLALLFPTLGLVMG